MTVYAPEAAETAALIRIYLAERTEISTRPF
jgi:hypothetical protein